MTADVIAFHRIPTWEPTSRWSTPGGQAPTFIGPDHRAGLCGIVQPGRTLSCTCDVPGEFEVQ